MMAGFYFNGSLDGSDPIIQTFVAKAAAVFSRGKLANLEAGEADAAATNDKALIGVCMEDVDNTNDGESVSVVINPGAIYAIADATARSAGDLLDIGADGMSVAAPTNNDLIVVSDSTADEPTRVAFNASHFMKR